MKLLVFGEDGKLREETDAEVQVRLERSVTLFQRRPGETDKELRERVYRSIRDKENAFHAAEAQRARERREAAQREAVMFAALLASVCALAALGYLLRG